MVLRLSYIFILRDLLSLLILNDLINNIFLVYFLAILKNFHGLLEGLGVLNLVSLVFHLFFDHRLDSRTVILATRVLDFGESLQLNQVLVDFVLWFFGSTVLFSNKLIFNHMEFLNLLESSINRASLFDFLIFKLLKKVSLS